MPSYSIKKFTDNLVKGLQPEDREYSVSCNSLILRVYPTGVKTWYYNYRNLDGKPDKLKIGKYPLVSLYDANLAVAESRSLLEKVIDPKEHKQSKNEEALAAKAAAITLSQLADRFLNEHAIQESTIKDYRSDLERNILNTLGDVSISDLKEIDVKNLLFDMVDAGTTRRTELTLAALSSMFNWAIENDVISNHPFPLNKLSKQLKSKLLKLSATVEKKRPKKSLDDDEISIFLKNVDVIRSRSNVTALKLCLFLARRETEVCSAKWNEFDLKKGEWVIPATRVINNKIVSSGLKIKLANRSDATGLMVPLPSHVVDMLRAWKGRNQYAAQSEFLFPSEYEMRLGEPMDAKALARALARNYLKIGVEKFTPHDLRRTAVTHFSMLGIDKIISNRISGHSISCKITETYDLYQYYKEKKTALQLWSDKLTKLSS